MRRRGDTGKETGAAWDDWESEPAWSETARKEGTCEGQQGSPHDLQPLSQSAIAQAPATLPQQNPQHSAFGPPPAGGPPSMKPPTPGPPKGLARSQMQPGARPAKPLSQAAVPQSGSKPAAAAPQWRYEPPAMPQANVPVNAMRIPVSQPKSLAQPATGTATQSPHILPQQQPLPSAHALPPLQAEPHTVSPPSQMPPHGAPQSRGHAPQLLPQQAGAGAMPSWAAAAATAATAAAATAAMQNGVSGGAHGSAMEEVAKGVALDYLNKVDAGFSTYTGSYLATLRFYFDVNNEYVLQKLKLLLFPFKKHEWTPSDSNSGQLRPPKDELNSPDLYIPAMAFATYILAMGFALGAQGRFTPDVLGLAGSSGLVILFLEVMGIKLTFYLTNGTRLAVLDLCSCCGYKFVGVVLVLAAKALLGSSVGYLLLLLSCASIGTFMVKTLRHLTVQGQGFTPGFITEGIASPAHSEVRKMQDYALWAVGGLQVVWSWYLSHGV